MKEFQSNTGGRHAYNTDFKNLQELALAMQEIFRECGSDFVISGCEVTESGGKLSVAEGYVYLGNKVRRVEAASNLQSTSLYIVAKQRNGDTIPYADGGADVQYIEYYAEVASSVSAKDVCITYSNSHKAFPNLATAFFNYYAVCKRAGNQAVGSLTVEQNLTVLKQLLAPQGVQLDNSTVSIVKKGNEVCVVNGSYSLCFSDEGVVALKRNNMTVLAFSEGLGAGKVTFGSVTVQSDLRTKKLYINGVDVETRLVPLGTVQMWAGSVDKIPEDYRLCDGRALSSKTFSALYAVIGDTFNTGRNTNGSAWTAPPSGSFRLPDLRQRFIAGYDPAQSDYSKIGTCGGEKQHVLSTNEMPQHTHAVDDYYFIEKISAAEKPKVYGSTTSLGGNYLGSHLSDYDNNNMLYKTHPTASSGNSNGHENRPPYYVLAYIMRVK